MKTKVILVMLAAAIITTIGCRQIKYAANLAKCDFRLKDVSNIKLADIDVQKIESWSDIGFMDIAKLTAAFAQGSLPLNLNLNVEIRNPNTELAALNRLDWILMNDETQIAEGTTNQRVEVQANGGIAVMTLSISSDVTKVLSGQSLQSLVNLVLNMTDSGGKPTKLMLKAKPYISVGKKIITYPGYINIKMDFISE